MSKQKRHVDQVEQLFNRIVEELQVASDDEILEGESSDNAKQRGLTLLHRARATAGRARLVSAREALSSHRKAAPTPPVTAEAARDYIQRVISDPRYTLAARQLSEMSDEDALAIYAQIFELEQGNLSNKGE